jgi:DNA-binding transcriptional ArsR family regulator
MISQSSAATTAADDRAYRALSHHDRRRVLRAIADGERAVGDLAATTGLHQPIASQHLRVLREAGLVSVRVDGNRRLYSVDFARMGDLRRFLDQFWSNRLDRLRIAAEGAAS